MRTVVNMHTMREHTATTTEVDDGKLTMESSVAATLNIKPSEINPSIKRKDPT